MKPHVAPWFPEPEATLDAFGLHEIPENSVDIDILIGDEAHVGKGLGPSALDVLAAEIRRDPTVPLLGLTTSVENTRAHRGFAKAGFRITRQYTPSPMIGACHLMLRALR